MYKHLIFDLDGTIIDTLPAIVAAANLTLKYYKKNYQINLKQGKEYVGYGTPYLITNTFKQEKRDDYNEVIKYFISQQITTHKKYAKIFPYLYMTLASLQALDYQCYVATNKPEEVAKFIVPRLYGERFFVDIVGQKTDTPKKPDPFVINEIIKRNHLKREECIYVGDHECDIETAHNAHIPCIIFKFGYGHYEKEIFKKAKYIISSPEELLEYLK